MKPLGYNVSEYNENVDNYNFFVTISENNEFLIKYGDDKENILTFAWIFCLVI